MKNAFVALALVLVLSTAFASKASNTKARLQKVASTPFGKTILETIQVELQTKDDPRPEIIRLLEELQAKTLQGQAELDAGHAAAGNRYDEAVERWTSDRDSSQSALDDAVASQTAKTNQLNQDNDELESTNTLLGNLQNELDQATSERQAHQDLWERNNEKYQSILDVLQQVRQVLTQRLSNRYNSEFLQAAHKEILGTFAQVKETVHSKKFKKLSPGFSKLVAFITMKVEAALNDPEDEDAEAGLSRIIQTIDDLAGHAETTKDALNDANNQEIEAFNANSERLTTAISTQTSRRDNLQNEIADLTQSLNALAVDIERLQGEIATAAQNLVDNAAQWDEENRTYAATTHDYNDQLALLEEVEDIVKNQLSNLRAYAEDYIGNH